MANSIRLYLSLLETPRFFLLFIIYEYSCVGSWSSIHYSCATYSRFFLWMYCVDTFIYIWFPSISRHQIINWDLIIVNDYALGTERLSVPNHISMYLSHSHPGLIWKIYDLGSFAPFFDFRGLLSLEPIGLIFRLCSNLVVSLRHQNRVVLSWDDIVILSRVNVSGILFCYHCSIWTSINLSLVRGSLPRQWWLIPFFTSLLLLLSNVGYWDS